jgi:hypothetical protein
MPSLMKSRSNLGFPLTRTRRGAGRAMAWLYCGQRAGAHEPDEPRHGAGGRWCGSIVAIGRALTSPMSRDTELVSDGVALVWATVP